MRAVVLEKDSRYAALLTENGDIIKKKAVKAEVGEEIELKDNSLHVFYGFKKAAISLSCAAAMLFGGVGTYSVVWAEEVSYVSLDSDVSIEYSLNRLNRVVDVKSLNEDSEDFVNELLSEKIKGKTFEDALGITE